PASGRPRKRHAEPRSVAPRGTRRRRLSPATDMKRSAVLASALALALTPAALAADGRRLYFENCVWCHGDRLQGVRPTENGGPGGRPAAGPPLRGAGEAAADFYLRTGYMPLSDPYDQPKRKHTDLGDREIRALVSY